MKKKGFTLIELLAVIVILGLLMAIAIPSVTKYITQSRKKTLTTTMGNYASALVTEVNNMEYIFTETNTIYAVPVECVEVERGGKNPFGEWSPATENHWAYILVQYDDKNSSYTYGFTFKDSAGYGMYPTTMEKLKESGSQIQTDLNFNVPKTGLYTNFVTKEVWEKSGFKVDDATLVKIYENTDSSCDIKKNCDGNDFNIGSIIACGNEKFRVISSNNEIVTMLAEERIELSENKPKQQKTIYKSTGFCSTRYWIEDTKLKPQYGTKFPAFVYDSNTIIYKYVEAYERYLKEDIGVTSANASVISYEQLTGILGCSSTDCNVSPYISWINKGYNWWTGTASGNGEHVYIVWENGNLPNFNMKNPYSVRPIVTISKKEIIIG